MKHLILLTDVCAEVNRSVCPLRRGHKIIAAAPTESAVQLLPQMQWAEPQAHAVGDHLYVTQGSVTYTFPRKCCSASMYGGGIHFLVASIRETELEVIRVRRVDETPDRSTIPLSDLRDVSLEELRKHPLSTVLMHDACSRYIEAVTVGT